MRATPEVAHRSHDGGRTDRAHTHALLGAGGIGAVFEMRGDALVAPTEMFIDANRYSVPFALIGKTVQVVRQGGSSDC